MTESKRQRRLETQNGQPITVMRRVARLADDVVTTPVLEFGQARSLFVAAGGSGLR